jgi:hypothetical protein
MRSSKAKTLPASQTRWFIASVVFDTPREHVVVQGASIDRTLERMLKSMTR